MYDDSLNEETCISVQKPYPSMINGYVLHKRINSDINPVECAVWCHHNTVDFLPNAHNRHPIIRPQGRGTECLLWV